MSHIRGLFLLLLLGLGVAAQASNAEPAGANADPATLARAALERSGCQLELPVSAGGHGGRNGARSGADGVRSQPPSSPWQSMRPGGLSLAGPVLWLMLGLAIVGLVVVIVRNLTGRGEPARRPAAPRLEASSDPLGTAVEPVPDYDQLAAQGAFPAAVHALLRHALTAWVGRFGALPPHTTGRQAVRRVRDRALPVDDFAALVRANERVHFGAAAADAELFLACRQHLEHWRQACRATP